MMPVYVGDTGFAIEFGLGASFNEKSTKVLVRLVSPSATIYTRQGKISGSKAVWIANGEFTEAGIYKISFEVSLADGQKFYNANTLEVLSPALCPRCDGRGWVRDSAQPSITVACPQCNGNGHETVRHSEELCLEMKALSDYLKVKSD